jgi:hypothetical protein
MECEESDLVWDDSIDMEGYTEDNVCTVVTNTEGGNCNDWCEF